MNDAVLQHPAAAMWIGITGSLLFCLLSSVSAYLAAVRLKVMESGSRMWPAAIFGWMCIPVAAWNLPFSFSPRLFAIFWLIACLTLVAGGIAELRKLVVKIQPGHILVFLMPLVLFLAPSAIVGALAPASIFNADAFWYIPSAEFFSNAT